MSDTTTTESTTSTAGGEQMTTSTTESQTATETPTDTTSTNAPAAATGSCTAASTFTVSNTAAAAELSACTTFTGSLAVATEFVGAFTLEGVEEITGDLNATLVPGLISVAGPSLRTVTGELWLQDLIALTDINLPVLTSLGTLEFARIGTAGTPITVKLNALDTVAKGFYLWGTALTTLDGISLGTANDINIFSDSLLTSIDLPVTSVRNDVIINANSAAVVFMDLADVGSTTFISNASSVSLPALRNGSLSLTTSTVETLDLPLLTSTAYLYLKDNPKLTSINVPVLASIAGGSGIDIETNLALTGTIEFPALRTLSGGFIGGSYSSLDFPALTTLAGNIALKSTSDISATCSHLESLVGTTGHTVTCNGVLLTQDHSSSSSSNKGGVIGGSVGGVVAFFVIVGLAAVGGYFWWMRRKNAGRRRRGIEREGGFEMNNQGGGRY